MTPSPDRIRADVQAALEAHGIAPRRALRAAVRLVRGLALADRVLDRDPCETLYNMRDRVAELLHVHGLTVPISDATAGQIIDWLRKNWGGRNLTRQWWGFPIGATPGGELTAELFPVQRDLVKSFRGRELRSVIWGILIAAPGHVTRICSAATVITAMIETDWATIYVPKGDDLDRQERDKKVYQQFGGLGTIERITALGISQSRAYEINKRVREERERREQPKLPAL